MWLLQSMQSSTIAAIWGSVLCERGLPLLCNLWTLMNGPSSICSLGAGSLIELPAAPSQGPCWLVIKLGWTILIKAFACAERWVPQCVDILTACNIASRDVKQMLHHRVLKPRYASRCLTGSCAGNRPDDVNQVSTGNARENFEKSSETVTLAELVFDC